MIKRLRRKFIFYSFISVFFLLLISFVTVNAVNFGTIIKNADDQTSILVQNNGMFPWEKEGEATPPGELDKQKTILYFSVIFETDGTKKINIARISTVTPELAVQIAENVKNKDKGWAQRYFRFRTAKTETQTIVAVINAESDLMPCFNVAVVSTVALGAGSLISVLLLWPISKLFIHPLEEAQKKQKRFISEASHEFKTPLAIISANNELEEMTVGQNEQTKTIAKQVDRLNGLVKGLNHLSMLTDSEEKPAFKNLDLSSIANESLSSFAGSFEKKKIPVETNIHHSIHFSGEKEMLDRLFTIIFDNALKYAKSYVKVSMFIDNKRIIFQEENDANYPIPEGPIDHVFERFYRNDNARALAEGSGLGLCMASEICQRLHIEIAATGVDGKFVITMSMTPQNE